MNKILGSLMILSPSLHAWLTTPVDCDQMEAQVISTKDSEGHRYM